MPAPQSFEKHSRQDPLFHLSVLPLLVVNFGFSIYFAIHYWSQPEHLFFAWSVLMAVVFILMSWRTRTAALQVQDRVIRMEGRLRLINLMMAGDRPIIEKLSTRQLVALRFAPDAELPALAKKAVAENLEPKAIKQAITNWRADHERV
jgi:hypothetical protein